MSKKYIKASLLFNLVIVIFTLFASIMMFTGLKFMDGDLILETTKLGMFKFFTVDSNIFMGIISLIFCINEILILKGKKDNISNLLYIFKYMATCSVTLTFFIVFTYLAYIVDGGVIILLKNSNLFFHLIIPVLSIITFIFFEKGNVLKFKYTLFGIVPTIIYGLCYLINVLVHIENGKVKPIYDWYYFVQGGLNQVFIVFPIMLVISYILGLILWKLNKKKE